jgi:hypothetical protein
MSDLRAGAARRSLAPSASHLEAGVWLGGFGSYRQRRATEILDAPECRALALSDETGGILLAAMDMIGASGPLLADIRSRVASATGIPEENILVACTHSHASPDLQGLWGGVSAAYAGSVVDIVVATLTEAWQARQPAELRASTTAFDGLVRNRRDWPMTDTTLTVLRAVTTGGSPIATVINYACHPTATGSATTGISRDWCGVTADIIDREAGGVTLYVNGAIGDVNPLFSGDVNHARTLGQSVAAWALEALASSEAVGTMINVRTGTLELPVNVARLRGGVSKAIDGAELSLPSTEVSSDAVADAGRPDLAQILAAVHGIEERPLISRDETTLLPTLCSYVRIGDIQMLTAPGEMMTRLALPLRSSLDAPHRMMLGLTHDALGYFIPRDEFMTGRNNNYEESVSMGFHAGALLSEKLVELSA